MLRDVRGKMGEVEELKSLDSGTRAGGDPGSSTNITKALF